MHVQPVSIPWFNLIIQQQGILNPLLQLLQNLQSNFVLVAVLALKNAPLSLLGCGHTLLQWCSTWPKKVNHCDTVRRRVRAVVKLRKPFMPMSSSSMFGEWDMSSTWICSLSDHSNNGGWRVQIMKWLWNHVHSPITSSYVRIFFSVHFNQTPSIYECP
jgi:hypothetical protein